MTVSIVQSSDSASRRRASQGAFRSRLLIGVGAAGLLAATGAAAQSVPDPAPSEPRWYGAIDVGYHGPETIRSHSTGLAPDGLPYDWRWRFTDNWAGFVRFGYRFTRHFRVELEGGYRPSRIDSVLAAGGESGGLAIARPGEPFGLCSPGSTPLACRRPGGLSNSWSVMSNVIYDLMPERRFSPFVGVGVGIDHIQFHGDDQFGNVTGPISASNPAVQSMNIGGTVDHPSQFAFQALGGVSWRMSRKIRFDLTYRFMNADRLRWNSANTTPGIVPPSGLEPLDFRGALHDQSVTAGVRYGF